jgi:hypothetical protein
VTNPSETSTSRSELHELALTKMSRVLGEERARRLASQILAHLCIELRTPDDLHAFAAELQKLGGFEGAVGAMLSVRAVMNGAAIKADAAER